MFKLNLGVAFTLGISAFVTVGKCTVTANLTGFVGCDALISAGLQDIVVFPADTEYTDSISTYYSSENRRLQPFCIVQPLTTKHVSRAVKALSAVQGSGDWAVAVRGGGHSDYNNNAVERGVTIDLTFFNSTKLVKGSDAIKWTGVSKLTKSIAQIQPGARWGSVYTYLESFNLAVTGGRSGHVGAGGLLVSGGASYQTQLWGIAANNVLGYEVVLADGSIVEANVNENADLFKALKGGGSNLGVVTRFDLRTFTIPPTGAYGGLVFSTWDDLEVTSKAFIKYASASSKSPDHWFIVFQYADGAPYMMHMAVSTDGNKNSTTFAFLDDVTITTDIRATQPISQIAATIADTGGQHYIAFTQTLQANKKILDKAADLFVELNEDLVASGIPAGTNYVFQPLPKNPNAPVDGGDIFGHDQNLPADSILFEARATLAAGDANYHGIVQSKMGATVEALRAYSASLAGHSTYLYMNYANPGQDVIGSYGTKNVQFLARTADKYDPEGFFQTRVPGGWKVSRV